MKPLLAPICLVLLCSATLAESPDDRAKYDALKSAYESKIASIIKGHCQECHSDQVSEAEISFESMRSIQDVRKHAKVWQKVSDVVDSHQMPPKDAKQLNDRDRTLLQTWVHDFLTQEAKATAGDPGPVVLRRLNNAEYTYTLRDLTGIASLSPTREFPADSAAGEGFTNTGAALVMSPSLVTKYLDAAKEVSKHLVLQPDGIRFSEYTTSSDWTNETLALIRDFYAQYTDAAGGDTVNLQGIVFDTNQGGRLPLEKYLAALLESRSEIKSKKIELAKLAAEKKLSPVYLQNVWNVFENNQGGGSLLLEKLRKRWREIEAKDATPFAGEIGLWQKALWKFSSVGHIGKVNGPKAWQEPVNPLMARQEFRSKINPAADGKDITLYLSVGDAGDGNDNDFAMIERPRLVMAGRPDLLLRDLQPLIAQLASHRDSISNSAARSLEAASVAQQSKGPIDLVELSKKFEVPADTLRAWFDYLGIGISGEVALGTPISRKMESSPDYNFIKGWVGDDALSVIANSSDQHVRIPGNMYPHSVAVHPSPTQSVAVGWKAEAATDITLSGVVQHAHPECGNGVVWNVELRRGNTRQRLAGGTAQGPNKVPFEIKDTFSVQAGDVIAMVISPRDGNHSCDLTSIDMTIHSAGKEWNLAKGISGNVLQGNPCVDGVHGGAIWYFYSEPTTGASGHMIPAGSMLATWQAKSDANERKKLADSIQKLLVEGPKEIAADSPDRALHQQLTSMGGPLMAAALQSIAASPASEVLNEQFGLPAKMFGVHPDGSGVEPSSLCLKAPGVLEIRLPNDLAAGAELVFASYLHAPTGNEGSVQVQLLTEKPASAAGLQPTAVTKTNANGLWSSNNQGVAHSTPILVNENTDRRKAIEQSFDEFRAWFPIALCYTKIVPVDEVVTLTLFYREDDQLQKLMLDDAARKRLDQLWNELHFSAKDAIKLVDAYEQLWQYATQDADPSAFEPLREPILKKAAEFRNLLETTQPIHVAKVLEFIESAYRRPLNDREKQELQTLYATLRKQELPHEDSVRLMFARALVAPAFLYRIERPKDGLKASQVSDWELASRLSYFLWSSAPDKELRDLAAEGKLSQPEVLKKQTARMLQSPKVRRMATEFFCQWLHIYEFDQHDEKSETHFPEFGSIKSAMYEESIQFFTDLVRSNHPFIDLFQADYTFLNESLAKYYGIPGVEGDAWRKVDGVATFHRGGVLGLSTTLAKQSGASRTSPILRGNWLSEVVLGEKLPKPPKNVPPLSETAPEGMTERQMIERHSIDEACAKCHARIDPFGFALEGFDGIGRYREKNQAGLPIDARTSLPDGTEVNGAEGLKDYLTQKRTASIAKQFNRKLLGYALGRSVQLSDEPLLAELTALSVPQSKTKNNEKVSNSGLHDIVQKIVLSPQFREIRGREHPVEEN